MKVIHNKDLKQITFLDERFYLNKKSGKYQPSITTYLEAYMKGFGFDQYLKDVGHNADIILKRAQEQGTHVHEGIDLLNKGEKIEWVTGETDNYTLREWLMILKYVEFIKIYKPEVIASEISMVSDELKVGGTLDLICKIPMFPDDIWLIDHKTGKAIRKKDKIQLAAGMRLWNSQMKEKITRVGCLHLQALTRGPDRADKRIQGKGWKVDEADDLVKLYKLFEHTQAIWNEENPNPRPKNVEYPDTVKL